MLLHRGIDLSNRDFQALAMTLDMDKDQNVTEPAINTWLGSPGVAGSRPIVILRSSRVVVITLPLVLKGLLGM